MTLHLVSLPHTSTTYTQFAQCAFTQRNTKFPAMMKPFGYEVITYGSDKSDAGCENVAVITQEQQNYFLSDYDWYKNGLYYKIPFDDSLPIWRFFIKNLIKQLKKRVNQDDLILISSPIYYKPLHREFPNVKIVEYGVGYPRVLAPYRVFESEAWRNFVYGSNPIQDHEYMNDVVIPTYYDEAKFPLVKEKEDYFLFMGRPIPSKGWAWVQILAAQGHKVKVAGSQKVEGKNIEWVGYVDGEKKAQLMGRAKALLSPTIYLEPFGGVVAEAALCGTPAITTDWGCYHETVEHGKTGFWCKNMIEISQRVKEVDSLDPEYIAARARSLWDTSVVGKLYHEYFSRLS
jgi:glycosyltransferase involved in cell wall biosynthesis